jgi:hypothetical protein
MAMWRWQRLSKESRQSKQDRGFVEGRGGWEATRVRGGGKRKQRTRTQKRSKRIVYTNNAKAAGGQDKEGGNARVVDKGSGRGRAMYLTWRQEVEGKKIYQHLPNKLL